MYRPRRQPSLPAPDAEAEARPRRPKTREEQREALLAYAFRALGARAVTEAELRGKLERRSEDPELIEDVLRRVQELGYQNDAEVARAENKRRGVGGMRVRQTLRRRGVGAELIEETLQARDPEQEQQQATELLLRRWPALSRKRDPRASAYAFLARRGFGGNVIWPAIREVAELFPPDETEDEEGAGRGASPR